MDWWIPSFLPSKSQYHLKVTPCPNLVPPHGKWPIDKQPASVPCGVVWLAPIGCGSMWSCLIGPNWMRVHVELFDWPQLDAGPCRVVWLAPTGCGSMWSRLIGPNFQQPSRPQIWTLWMGQTSRVQLYVVCAFGSFDTNFIICRIYVEIFINYPFFLYFPLQEHNSVKENRESLGNIHEYFSNIVYFSTFNMESSKLINYVFIIQ